MPILKRQSEKLSWMSTSSMLASVDLTIPGQQGTVSGAPKRHFQVAPEIYFLKSVRFKNV